MRTGYDSSFLQITHDAEHRVLELEWIDFATSTQLREGLLMGVQLAQELHVQAWVNNLKGMRVIRPLDQEWICEEWFPQFATLGIRRLAIVESDDALNRLGLTQIMKRANGYVPQATTYFPDKGAARLWARAWQEETPVLLRTPTTPLPQRQSAR